MESLKEDLVDCLREHDDFIVCQLGNYLFLYPTKLEKERYSCKDYSGIIFETDDCRYDVCNNYLMGFRLIINPKAGGFKDIPFKPATFGLLPEDIIVKEIGKHGV